MPSGVSSFDDLGDDLRAPAGSMSTFSAMSGSVMMVAGLELTRTTSIPSFAQGLAGLGAGEIELRGLADTGSAA